MRNLLLFTWDRSLPGREQLSGKHFQDFMAYLQAQKSQGTIESFETAILAPRGAGIHGFFAIKGAPEKLSALTETPEWTQHMMRATMHLEGASATRGVTGAGVGEHMAMWSQLIPN